MQQSSFDIIVTGSERSQVISFLQELLHSDSVCMSDLYGSMNMCIGYGEYESMAVLNRNGQKLASLFDIQNERDYHYNVTVNHPNLKKYRLLNLDFGLFVPVKPHPTVIQAVEGCKLFLYALPVTADVNLETKNLHKLVSLCQNGVPCVIVFTGFRDKDALNKAGIFASIIRFTKDIGLNASFFMFTAKDVPDEVKYHFRYGKDELWQLIADCSDIKDSLVFGKETGTLLNTMLATIEVIERIVPKYNFAAPLSKEIQESMYIIKRKCNDANFYLGIAGEFSSGKSTLINAILREDLLTTSAIQSTTCAATYLSYSSQISIKVKMNDGTIKDLLVTKKEDMKQLFKMIDDFAAEENIAAQVETVHITYPFTGRKSDFTIIDTPGINVGNERHLALTTSIIKKECDALVIVISADSPMNHTLENFIRDNIGLENQKCIFAITKLDYNRDQENMNRILQDITNKLKNVLNFSNPVVVPMTSIVMLDSIYQVEGRFHRDIQTGFKEYLYQKFVEGEALIMETLHQNKMKIQYEKILSVLQVIYETLYTELKGVSDGLYQDFKILLSQDPDEMDDTKAANLLKKKQLVNQDLKQLLQCKDRLDKLGGNQT